MTKHAELIKRLGRDERDWITVLWWDRRRILPPAIEMALSVEGLAEPCIVPNGECKLTKKGRRIAAALLKAQEPKP